MKAKISRSIMQALSFGVLSGIRSMSAPAILSHVLSKSPSAQLEGTRYEFLQTKDAADWTRIGALAEIFADKLPFVPDRTTPVSLAIRAATGAFTGAAASKALGEDETDGALAGAAAAVIATYGAFYLRKALIEKVKLPNAIAGAVEDLLIVAAAKAICSHASKHRALEFEEKSL